MPEKDPGIVGKLDDSYNDFKKKVGLGRKVPKKLEMRVSIDQDVNAALTRAEEATKRRSINIEDTAAQALSAHARNLSTRLLDVDNLKARYKALADDIE